MNRQNQNVMNFGGFLDDLLNSNGGRALKNEFLPHDWLKNESLPVNLREQEDRFRLEALAPGFSKDDFKIEVTDNVLTLSLQNKEEVKKEENQETEKAAGDKILKHEFEIHPFKRSFKLGNKVDAARISAQYENGILHLSLPKKEGEKASNISISVD